MSELNPLQLSRLLLAAIGTRMFVYHQDRIPQQCVLVVVSNHRGVLDAPLLMVALRQPIRVACHHYMGQVPLMQECVRQLGCFPLEKPQQRGKMFVQQATQLLRENQWVGVFPEGAQPMVKVTQPSSVGEFHRGFAHLALKAPVQNLAILPVAIASLEETVTPIIPLRWLRLFDPSEPLFNRPGWHPMVVQKRVIVSIGHPYWITAKLRKHYKGKHAKDIVNDVTTTCRDEITQLLQDSIH